MNQSGKSLAFFAAIVILILLSACNTTSEGVSQNILSTAWSTCNSVSGMPTGLPFTGKAVLVWNLHPQMLSQRKNEFAHTEQIGSIWLTDAPYFILGDYSVTRYYPEYNTGDLFTLNINEVSAFLCLSVKYTDIQTCEYAGGFSIIRSTAETDVKLVSWPNKNLIAETHEVTSQPDECPYSLNTSQMSNNLVDVKNIDIWKWFLKYKQ